MWASLLAVLAVVGAARVAEGAPVRRFAVVAGANDGGPERVTLRFAESDARAFARVLEELGGLDPSDVTLIAEPDPAALEGALRGIAGPLAEARRSGARTELFFYFSGHSDERGLLLGGEQLPYDRLREAIFTVPADVRIAILDSCASGALTREKGGVRRAAFQVDDSSRVRGTAFLTSASADEPAQESDRLGASFFTHHLVSGLRGAADLSSDGRVTLNEAYQYAFHETLSETEATQAGPQHSNYDMRLVGSGDLVITDLRATSAVLALPSELSGRLFVRDREGRLSAEVDKLPGAPVSLGLAPGTYTVTVDHDGRALRGTVAVTAGATTPLREDALSEVAVETTAQRGGERAYRTFPFNLALVPGVAASGFDSSDVVQGVALNLIGGYAARLEEAEIALGESWETESVTGVQLAGGFNVSGGPLVGVQASAGVNVAAGAVAGGQITVGVNVAGASLDGFQGTAGVNVVADRLRGLQVAPLNVAGPVDGVQLADVNIALGDVTGLQLAMVNVSTGRVHGVQLGIVNYAKDVDAPIGLLSIVEDGQFHADVWGSDATPVAAALRIGSRYVYNLFAVAVNPVGDEARWMLGLGIGGHIPIGSFFVDVDALSWHMTRGAAFETRLNLLNQLRLSAGYRIAPRLAVFAGATMNALVSDVDDGADWRLGSVFGDTSDGTHIQLWPGFMAGVRI